MYNNSLAHHGIKGQKWGVRRYQNADGSLTPEGKARYRVKKISSTRDQVQNIVDSMSEQDKKQLGLLKKDEGQYMKDVREGEWIVKRMLLKEGDLPVAFFDIYGDGKTSNIAIGVRGDKQGKGYGSKITKKGMNWIDKHLKDYEHVEWSVLDENTASKKLAERNGFEYYDNRDYTNENGVYKTYIKQMKKK